ncbi:MAG TPA: tRNA glutamyl-Q(34) synthetase GluQRS, partial [Limnochordia bacterium]|nr:tRNA glutamyl-Q(34) synthetase GluQRS [Limnochordia bacterium]
MVVRGRFAPSPTSFLHLGNARTALLAWLQARAAGGRFILRDEDLDPARSKPEYARAALEDLAWLGLDWDEGPDVGGPAAPYRQSERGELYRAALSVLAARGLLYACRCTRAELREAAAAPHGAPGVYPGTCRPPGRAARPSEVPLEPGAGACDAGRSAHLRLIAEGRITFTDGVYGPQSCDLAAACGDFVVRRADGAWAYQLAVAVDDADMGVTHVVRGDDLLDSTPRQIYLLRCLAKPVPRYTHVPLLLDPSGRRLAKRDGDLTLRALRAAGAMPERVVGYLAFLSGLAPSSTPVRCTELIAGFDLARLDRRPAVVSGEA